MAAPQPADCLRGSGQGSCENDGGVRGVYYAPSYEPREVKWCLHLPPRPIFHKIIAQMAKGFRDGLP